jgi:hypothetical protein
MEKCISTAIGNWNREKRRSKKFKKQHVIKEN